MSAMLNPQGPLPPRVYWMRRGIVVVALALVVVLIVWAASAVFGSDGDSRPGASASERPTNPPQTAEPNDQPADGNDTPGDKPTQEPRGDGPKQKPTKATKPTKPTEPPKPTMPTTACDPTRVDMAIEVGDAELGTQVPATFELTPLDGAECALSITPDNLEVQVTTGDTVVWSSSDCPDALVAKKVAVRPDEPGTYAFTWDGRVSDSDCELSANNLGGGGYYVRAAFIGGEPHEAYFDMR